MPAHLTPTVSGESRPFLVGSRIRPGLWSHLFAFLVVAGAAEVSQSYWAAGAEAALIWPPAGLALGMALTFGPRILPGIAGAVLLWGIASGGPGPLLWTLPALGLALGAWAASEGLRSLRDRDWLGGPIRELIGFWAVGLTVTAGISSPLGALAVRMQPAFSGYDWWTIWAAYWISEAFGILVFGPLTTRLSRALAQGQLASAIAPARWQPLWLGLLVLLVSLQLGLGEGPRPEFGAALVYLYFPLLAVAAGLGTPLFQDIATACIAMGVVSLTLLGAGGLEIPQTNFEIINVVLLVTAFAVMTQLVSAMATSLRAYLSEAREMARRDFLTGLFNDRELATHLATGEPGALVLLKTGGLNRALSLMGLQQTNEIEQEVANRLASKVDESVLLARIGRDLFALYRPGRQRAPMQEVAEACYEHLDGLGFQREGVPLTLQPACGGIVLDRAHEGADQAMAMAGQALDEAQTATPPRIRIRHADPARLETARADQELAEHLRAALRKPDGLALMVQPIVPLQGQQKGPPSLEVLLRLPDPEGNGALPPARFLDTAARHGLMPEVDRWVIGRALDLAASHYVQLSVNLSGASLADPDLLAWIEQERRSRATPTERICFEVTETESIHTFEAASGLVSGLRQAGYPTALDDFGTGLASFEYLRNLPFDVLKIDGSFVRTAVSSPVERAMVEAIQKVAATARLCTVAEFVEDAETREWVTSIGVDYAQGWAMGYPRPVGEVLPSTGG